MAEAIASVVVEHVVSILEHQFLEEVNLVRGVGKKILSLSDDLKTIRNVLDDAEKKGAAGDKAVGAWLKKLENASYELDDVLDEWHTALRRFQIQQDKKCKVCNYTSFISCSSFQKLAVRRSIATKKAQVDLFPHLLLSYNELSPPLKRCFSYCAVFPKDTRINVEELIEHWLAVGYLNSDGSGTGDMELRGREYFDNLAMRSLFQDFEKNYLDGQVEYCKMHDIVHDFALLLRKNGDEEVGIKNTTTCEACNPLLVSCAITYRSVNFGNEEPHWPLCSCLANMRVLSLIRNFGRKRIIIPHEVEMFIHLRWLDLSFNDLAAKDLKITCQLYNLQTLLLQDCNLEEITKEIGNLIHLRHLNLRENRSLKELPESVCDLHELQRLNISHCKDIRRLPQGFNRLVNLKHLHNYCDTSLKRFPVGLEQLTGLSQLTNLRTLTEFHAGSGKSKLGWLKNLNHLSGSLTLFVHLFGSENIVEDAREGELRKKDCIQEMDIRFYGRLDRDLEWVSLLKALEPHHDMVKLQIYSFGGSKLPSWMVSPLNQLKFIGLHGFSHLWSLLSVSGKIVKVICQ